MKTISCHLAIAFAVTLLALAGCERQAGVDPAKQRAFATELLNRGLYEASAAAYDEYLEMPGVADDERKKVLYAVASTLMTDAKLYDEALVRFLKLHAFYPDYRQRDVNAAIVQCFERTGRSLEAQLALEQSAALERRNDTTTPGGTILAEVGDRKVTDRDLAEFLRAMPPAQREQFEGPEGRRELLRHLVGRELLYGTARRRGFENDPEITRQLDGVREDLMVQKAYEEEIGAAAEPTDMEVELYYQSHADEFAEDGDEPPPLEQIRPRVEAAVRMQKQREAVQGMIERGLEANDVRIYAERIR